jgi:hypothetical protein
MKVIHQLIGYLIDQGDLSAREIRKLSEKGYWAPPAPYNLRELEHEVGDRFYFVVKGDTGGPLWGTDVYTSDSAPGMAAVHAGLLAPGESRVLQVTIETPLQQYAGSVRHGVSSGPWNYWPGAYSLAAV